MERILCVICIFITAVYAVPNNNCSNLWQRWQQCPISLPPMPGGTRYCFIDGNQFFILTLSTNNGLALNCEGEPPNSELVDCLNVTSLYALGMRNCKYSNFILENYIGSKNTIYVEIIYDVISEDLMNTDLIISNIPVLKNITILGLRSTGLFNVTFGNLPSLYLLNITNHNFTSFQERPFRYLYTLQGISLRLGIIEVIPEDLFYGLENLRFLDLALNQIRNFHPETFKELPLLLDLDLSGNDIDNLPSSLFTDLNSLATLHIQSNKLTSLPSDLFQSIPNLRYFDISNNVITENIPDGFLKGAIMLEKFISINCSLSTLPEALFSDARYLTYIAFSVNVLKRIPQNLFNNTENLIYLFLDANEIEYLPARTFHLLFRLRLLSISLNKLSSLDSSIFVGLSSLSYLDLSYNKIVSIENSTFDSLVNLQELHISNNPLVTLPFHFPFGRSRYLSTIVITNCKLWEMPNVNWMLGNLTLVDFSYNIITNLTLPVFTKNRTRVLLLSNNISSIELDFKKVSNVSPFYYIQDNPLICDCNLRDFLYFLHSDIQKKNFIFPYANRMKCFGSTTKSLMDIWPPYKVCPLEKDCPPTCLCYVKTQQKVVIDCSNKELTIAPKIIPPETDTLYLQNNNLTKLPLDDLNSWQNIEKLSLSNNSLESLEEWHIPEKLKFLAIDGNLLTSLPSTVMERVDSVQEFQIYLADNSWQCDCQSVTFKRWFNKNKHKIKDSNRAFCRRQNHENGTETQSLILATPIDLFCLINVTRPTWQIATITIAVLILLFIVIALIYHRYHNTILSLLYSRNIYCFWWDKKDSDDDKIFDAFLCYSTTDRDIMIEMMKELEPSYKLCIHERDWLPGFAISHHIINSVKNSRKTLLLVSKNFLDSIWFQVEFRTAYCQMLEDKMHRLVLIIVGDIGDVNNLEEDLRHLLSTKTYLKWGEKWFWEKLRYALRRSDKNAERK